MWSRRIGWVAVLVSFVGYATPASAQVTVDLNIEEAPFHYSDTTGDNRVTRLIDQLERKQIKLDYTRERGYLESLLTALEIPTSSQTLVFSKTSMQVRYISRRNPRAIYFNDDTYLGWVHGSSLLEISTTDPKLGTAFYTVDMAPWRPKIERAYYDCLACHATSMTQGIPGHTVRSVMPTYDGSVDAQTQSYITSDESPISQRWGGWYVTGIHGDMNHLGNAYLRGGKMDTRNNANRMNLREEFDTHHYLSPYSDIAALMVLEHQTQMHNVMVRANFYIRQKSYDAESLDAAEIDEAESRSELQIIAREVVDRLLFCDEAALSDQVRGSVIFATDFQSRAKKDSHGRSLREFDLKTRMFKYPCSYLIHSDAFATLEPSLRNEILRQMKVVLTADDPGEGYAHLSDEDRSTILAILMETLPGFR